MATLDWAVVVGYCGIMILVGVLLSRRASQGTDDFFLSGRSLPWWLAGTSLVATSFASDTPLLVTGLVRVKGIWGNWMWWALAVSHVIAIFFFSRLWRRSRVVTEVELTELRYSGRPAAILRGFKALYFGLGFNCYVAGAWVMTGLVIILTTCVPELYDEGNPERSKLLAIAFCSAIALVYATLAGFWGVVATDFIQFLLAMGGALLLAGYAVGEVGGFPALWKALERIPEKTRFLPETGGGFWDSSFSWFLALVLVQWWAWKNTDGGGIAVQRMLACRNERHAVYAVLWFNIAHYALRCWPWILVALCSLILLSPGELPADEAGNPKNEAAYPVMINRLLPAGLKGLLVASFLAAFMSTIDTHVNWGSSYVMNDFYRRFVARKAGEKHYLGASRLAGLLVVLGAGYVAFHTERIRDAFDIILNLSAGVGLVYLARWFWWRTNAWSEISCMLVSLLVWAVSGPWAGWLGIPQGSKLFTLLFMIAGTVPVWVLVTLITRPVERGHLREFYHRCRPPRFGWGPVARECPEVRPPTKPSEDLMLCGAGLLCVFGFLFGLGQIVLGRIPAGLCALVAGGAALFFILVRVRRAPAESL